MSKINIFSKPVLEGEMFQLNNILTDQKTLMDDMIKTFQPKDQHTGKKLSLIMKLVYSFFYNLLFSDEKLQENKFQNNNVNKELERKKIMKSLFTKVEGCEVNLYIIIAILDKYIVHHTCLFSGLPLYLEIPGI